jgi:SAM-dependent methyltransferase
MSRFNQYAYVADIYDTYVRAIFDVPFFVNAAKKVTGEVLELMSGTGRLSLPLVQAGVRLTCIDLSAEMLVVLHHTLVQHGLSADLHAMNVCELALPKQFPLIINPFNSFAEIVAPEDQRQALRRIYQHLLPGGDFICTLHNPMIRAKSVDGQLKMWGKYPLADGEGSLVFWGYQEFEPAGSIVNIQEFFEEYDAEGILMAKRLQEVRFCLIQKADFEAMATAEGFKVKALYGNYDYAEFNEATSPFMIWILQK